MTKVAAIFLLACVVVCLLGCGSTAMHDTTWQHLTFQNPRTEFTVNVVWVHSWEDLSAAWRQYSNEPYPATGFGIANWQADHQAAPGRPPVCTLYLYPISDKAAYKQQAGHWYHEFVHCVYRDFHP